MTTLKASILILALWLGGSTVPIPGGPETAYAADGKSDSWGTDKSWDWDWGWEWNALHNDSHSGASRAPPVRVGRPVHSGTGCPVGTVALTYSPDQSALSVLFDDFIVELTENNPERHALKQCNVSAILTAPAGQRIKIFNVDYRGFADVPETVAAEFRVRHELKDAGNRRGGALFGGELEMAESFRGPFTDEFIVSETSVDADNRHRRGGHSNTRWSTCGGDVQLDVAMLLKLTRRSTRTPGWRGNDDHWRNDPALLAMDSADYQMGSHGEGAVHFQIGFEPCSVGREPAPAPRAPAPRTPSPRGPRPSR